MINFFRNILPRPVLVFIRPVKHQFIDPLLKKLLFYRMKKKHELLIECKKGKRRLRVVFLVIHRSVWKVDRVFQKMLQDPFFEPIILVCPYTHYDDERMWEDMNDTIAYFHRKNYKTISSYNEKNKTWISLSELEPDLVFFTNPHNLTRKEYYQEAYLNFLSCYVPYSFDVSRYDNYIAQYNQYFHNAIWRIFLPHQVDLEIYKNFSQAKARNTITTGYPFVESIINSNEYIDAVWKKQNKAKKKIIWAPHHTIDSENLPYASFLKIAQFMMDMAIKYSDEVQFAFKPHPILRSKLYDNISWGKEKTDEFYSFWDFSDNTQYCDTEYASLFLSSDGMIHDSGSFLAEYLFVEKPVLYTSNLTSDNMKCYYNDFGLSALDSHFIAEGDRQKEIIEKFILDIIDDNLTISEKHQMFIINNQISTNASELILQEIRNVLKRS
ncbi:hypothetical protein NMD75_12125 [Edwardsiella tarda]